MAVSAAVLCAVPASAQEKRFGAWAVGTMKENAGAFAATVNDSGGLLGQYCYREREQCVWLLSNDIGCEDGAKYPVLVNADSGAATTQIVCMKVSGKPMYAFAEFDLIDGIVRQADWVGFAFPMASGQFRVSRFALEGAASAVEFMRKVMDQVIERVGRSTKDQTY